MSISTYAELKTAISDWMARSDVSGSAADFITLGEARLNRLLEVVATTATLAGVVDSTSVSISALSIVEPVDLYVTDNGREYFVTPRALGSFTVEETSGLPSMWAIEGTNIKLDRPCDQTYSFRFVYQGRFALSDAVPTNEFLTNNPDLYMAASIVWGAVYTKDLQNGAMWKSMLDEFTAEVRSNIAQKKRSQLTVDPGLGVIGRGFFDRNILP
jgi:hypothetical protein